MPNFLIEIAPNFEIDFSNCVGVEKVEGKYLHEIHFHFENGTVMTQQYTSEKQRDNFYDHIFYHWGLIALPKNC